MFRINITRCNYETKIQEDRYANVYTISACQNARQHELGNIFLSLECTLCVRRDQPGISIPFRFQSILRSESEFSSVFRLVYKPIPIPFPIFFQLLVTTARNKLESESEAYMNNIMLPIFKSSGRETIKFLYPSLSAA